MLSSGEIRHALSRRPIACLTVRARLVEDRPFGTAMRHSELWRYWYAAIYGGDDRERIPRVPVVALVKILYLRIRSDVEFGALK
jgi:hypothetical protein